MTQSAHASGFASRPDGADTDYLVLRDGSTALLRVAGPQDHDAMRAFLDRLSPEAKRRRFFSQSESSELLSSLNKPVDPRSELTLVAIRQREGRPAIIASGSYWATSDDEAEVAFVVEDAFHGQGLGTLLLERLALAAAHQGFQRLWAITHAENLPMREVFRESGYELRETFEGGTMRIELSAVPDERGQARSDLRERLAATASLRPFFKPCSVAVIGASRDPESIGYRLLESVLAGRFDGPIYPVNPYASVLLGLPVFPSVRAIPGPVDLALVAVPCETVLTVVEDCAAKGARALIVITAGFAEVGREGRALQSRLLQAVRESGMRMVGPNCFGLVNTHPSVRLNATFGAPMPPYGRIAMSSQSGALGLAILRAAQRLNLGISTFVSVGNKADVSVNDLLQYWEGDPETDVVLLYQESFGNPRRFARIARRLSRRKPIVAVKAGRSQAGRRAAGSHTAALAASDTAVDALFQQAGVIRADTLDEMFALAALLAQQPLPQSRRVAVLTNAGGPAILCTDACEASGLAVPELSVQMKTRLRAFLPPAASVKNPVDLIASATPEQYREAIALLMASDEVDAIIVLYVSIRAVDASVVAHQICDAVARSRTGPGSEKTVSACWMAEHDQGSLFLFRKAGIPAYTLPETPAVVLGKTAAYAAWRRLPPGVQPEFHDGNLEAGRRLCQESLRTNGPGWLSADDTRRVLLAAGLPVPAGGVAASADAAVELARNLGYPVAVKLASRRIVHKSEFGGVHLNLHDEALVRRTCDDIRRRLAEQNLAEHMDGVLVQPMMAGGVEVMAGMTQDPLFGPLIAFGLGGIHVEILGDVRFRVSPLTDRDAGEMIREIKGYRLLEGYRGHPPADVQALELLLLRVSRLVETIPEIVELDLNPIFAFPPGQGCRIADARIRIDSPATPPGAR